MWCKKHQVKTLDEFYGNEASVRLLFFWVKKFIDGDATATSSMVRTKKKCFLLSGAPGTGKSALATLILGTLGFKPNIISSLDFTKNTELGEFAFSTFFPFSYYFLLSAKGLSPDKDFPSDESWYCH